MLDTVLDAVLDAVLDTTSDPLSDRLAAELREHGGIVALETAPAAPIYAATAGDCA
jgi:hypothetical protein